MDIVNFIIKNQITNENWNDINEALNNHDDLITQMALAVSQGKYGTGEERAAALGVYNSQVQAKINWAYKTAQDVWAGKYGSGEKRKETFGKDYDLIQYWVNTLVPSAIYGPSNVKYTTDNGGKRYVIKDIPTAKGKMTLKSYNQHKQGDNPFKFDGSGCGFMSFYSIISSVNKLDTLPKDYATKNLKRVTNGTKCPISLWAGCKLLDDASIKYTWVKGPLKTKEVEKDIQAHLEKGMPVIVSLSYADRDGKITKKYTNYAHYSVISFATKDGKWYLNDSGAKLPRYVDPDDICKYIPGTKLKPDYDPIWNGWTNAGGYVKINL